MTIHKINDNDGTPIELDEYEGLVALVDDNPRPGDLPWPEAMVKAGFNKLKWKLYNRADVDLQNPVPRDTAQVVKMPWRGTVFLAPRLLEIVIKPGTKASAIPALLKRHDLTQREKLAFAPDLVLATAPLGTDVLTLLAKLQAEPIVATAAPMWVQGSIGPRGDR